MKVLKVCVILLIAGMFIGIKPVFSESIYTKDGKVIKGTVASKSESAIWYGTSNGDVTEYKGIPIANVSKILNDDGSVSKYSPG